MISDVIKTLVPRPRPTHQASRSRHQTKITLFTLSGNRYRKSGMVGLFHQSSNQEKNSKTARLSVGYISYI